MLMGLFSWELAIGKGDATVEGFKHFTSETLRLLEEVSAMDRSNQIERQQSKQEFIDLMRDFAWIPTLACAVYIAIVHIGPLLVRKPWPVKWLLSLWNLALAIFSAVGSYHCLGALLLNMQQHGWRYTVCTVPKKIDLMGTDLDVWVCLFVLSKIAEFFDTILKILLKKKFIFLHWYHHLATAWLCWMSIAYDFAPGMWIAALNYTVHAPMYSYFFLSSILNKFWFDRICKPVAPLITTIQISQMAVFTVVNVSAVYYLFFDTATYAEACSVKLMNLHINALVVLSYLGLFTMLFMTKYCRNKKSSRSTVGVRHVVLLKLKMGTTAESKQSIVDGLCALPSKIPEISSFKVGEQIEKIDDGRNVSIGVVADFKTEADYKVYAAHADHKAVITGSILPALAPGGRTAIQFLCVANDGAATGESSTVRHVVLLKLHDATTMRTEMDDILSGLCALPSKIPEISSFKVGEQIEEIDDGRNVSIGVVAEFKTEADYKVYAAHADHKAVITGSILPALAPGGRSAIQFPCSPPDRRSQLAAASVTQASPRVIEPADTGVADTSTDIVRRSSRLAKKLA